MNELTDSVEDLEFRKHFEPMLKACVELTSIAEGEVIEGNGIRIGNFIVTAKHVLDESSSEVTGFSMEGEDGESFNPQLLYQPPGLDIAVLSVPKVFEYPLQVERGALKPGEEVFIPSIDTDDDGQIDYRFIFAEYMGTTTEFEGELKDIADGVKIGKLEHLFMVKDDSSVNGVTYDNHLGISGSGVYSLRLGKLVGMVVKEISHSPLVIGVDSRAILYSLQTAKEIIEKEKGKITGQQ